MRWDGTREPGGEAPGKKGRVGGHLRKEENMPRVSLDLNKKADQQQVGGQWRVGPGYIPGQPNEGLVSQVEGSPARLADYDDSEWAVCDNVRQSLSKGFTFCWWRITVQFPEQVEGVPIKGYRAFFETNVDNHGEIWVDGELPTGAGVIGNNVQQRVEISREATPGERHVIAVMSANGPLALPRGGVFLRYATLAFELAG